MRPMTSTVSMAAADADGVCQSQTPGGAGDLTINGALATGGVATMDVARHVSITSAGNDSGRTFTVTGTDRYGNTITEAITGPNATTVTGTKNFKTVTQVAIDDAAAGAITVGSADEAEGPWMQLDHYMTPFEVFLDGRLVDSGNTTFEVQTTVDKVQGVGFTEDQAVAVADATFTAKTAAFQSKLTNPVQAVRLALSGHSAGGVRLSVNQAGM